MNGYDWFKTYNAIKLHFTSEKYNFFQYDGKTRISVDAFQKRRDKFLFHRLARNYSDTDTVPFLVANFVHSDTHWAKSLLDAEAEKTYKEWKRITDSMSRFYSEDLRKIATPKTFDGLFKIHDGQHPKLLMHLLHKEITIETMVILNNIFGYIKIWDKNISEDVIYPKISLKIRKYGAFLDVEAEKYKKLTKEVLLSMEDAI